MKFKNTYYAAALLLLIPSCQSKTVNTFQNKNPNAQTTHTPHQKVITDNSLNQKSLVINIIQGKSGNLLKVQASLRNHTNKTTKLSYIFDWMDKDGFKINSPTIRWQQITLSGQEPIEITSLAPSPAAVDYRLKLKESKIK